MWYSDKNYKKYLFYSFTENLFNDKIFVEEAQWMFNRLSTALKLSY